MVPSPRAQRPPDLISDIRKINLPDACAEEVMAIHLWEHLWRWECDEVIEEWKRLMKPHAKLVMEMPDLIKCCDNIIAHRPGKAHPDQLGLWGLYGDPETRDPLMCHRWGWTFSTLKPFLTQHGFREVFERETQFHSNGRGIRDFRIEAIK